VADPQSNITEEGAPGDLSGAATDEFGGASDIAADDAGGSVLGSTAGQAAGGQRSFAAPSPEAEQAQGEIAADDAGGTVLAEQVTDEVEDD
jgi:hypothetical protein